MVGGVPLHRPAGDLTKSEERPLARRPRERITQKQRSGGASLRRSTLTVIRIRSASRHCRRLSRRPYDRGLSELLSGYLPMRTTACRLPARSASKRLFVDWRLEGA